MSSATATASKKAATVEPLLAVDEIQGDVIPGFKNDCQTFLFYRIEDPVAARNWLASLHSRIATAAQVRAANQSFSLARRTAGKAPPPMTHTWLNVALSATGLTKLTSQNDVNQFDDSEFKGGMAADSTSLGDPPGSADAWLVGGPNTPVDVVFILAGDVGGIVGSEEEKLNQEATSNGLLQVRIERGAVLPDDLEGHEHFGFKDGISDPAVRGLVSKKEHDYFVPRTIPSSKDFVDYALDFAAPGRTLVWPGHFLFGYDEQMATDPRTPDPRLRPVGPSWAENGSFLVFRRLRQDVAAFNGFVSQATTTLNASHQNAFSEVLVGACLVGRWKSGTPLMRSPKEDLGIVGAAANYFLYDNDAPGPIPGDDKPLSKADVNGGTCPASAHIRKVNPRDGATDLGGSSKTVPKLILRRGIPYGPPFDPTVPESGTIDRGLLFVAFQSSIHNQFKFLMSQWTNNADRPVQGQGVTGQDAVMGEPADARNFLFAVLAPSQQLALPNSLWVLPTGGEYLFAPSVGFFRDTLKTFAPPPAALV